MYLADIQVGDVIRFKYHAGSTPGQKRLVKVLEVVTGENIYCVDVMKPEDENKRRFKFDHISHLELVEKGGPQTETISLGVAHTRIRDALCGCGAEKLVAAYKFFVNDKARTIRYDGSTGNLIITG